MPVPERRRLGVRVIVLYKGIKALAEVVLAAVLVALAVTGEMATLRKLAIQLNENLASRWSVLVGRALAALISQRGVHLLELGLALDGVVSGIEGGRCGEGTRGARGSWSWRQRRRCLSRWWRSRAPPGCRASSWPCSTSS